MLNLSLESDRADQLDALRAATPDVNYQYKQQFVDALAKNDYTAAWLAAHAAGIDTARCETARKRFYEKAVTPC